MFVSTCLCKLGMELWVQYSKNGEPQLYNIHLLRETCADDIELVQLTSNLCRWGSDILQYSFALQLVQMRLNLWRWGQTSADDIQLLQMRGGTLYNIHLSMKLVQMRSKLCRWGVEHSTIFICLCNLCRWGVEHCTIFICLQLVYRWGQNFADEEWNTVQYLTLPMWEWVLVHTVCLCAHVSVCPCVCVCVCYCSSGCYKSLHKPK